MPNENCKRGMNKGNCNGNGGGCGRRKGQGNNCGKGSGNCNGEGRNRNRGNCCNKERRCERNQLLKINIKKIQTLDHPSFLGKDKTFCNPVFGGILFLANPVLEGNLSENT